MTDQPRLQLRLTGPYGRAGHALALHGRAVAWGTVAALRDYAASIGADVVDERDTRPGAV